MLEPFGHFAQPASSTSTPLVPSIGRFGTVRYRLHAPPKLVRTQTIQAHDVKPPQPAEPSTPRPQPTGPSEQLTLLAFD